MASSLLKVQNYTLGLIFDFAVRLLLCSTLRDLQKGTKTKVSLFGFYQLRPGALFLFGFTKYWLQVQAYFRRFNLIFFGFDCVFSLFTKKQNKTKMIPCFRYLKK